MKTNHADGKRIEGISGGKFEKKSEKNGVFKTLEKVAQNVDVL